MKIRRFGKIYKHKILIDRFYEFQKSTQKWKVLTFFAIFTHYKAFNGIIFIFLIYCRPLRPRWCIFQKNPSQFFLVEIIVSLLIITEKKQAYIVQNNISLTFPLSDKWDSFSGKHTFSGATLTNSRLVNWKGKFPLIISTSMLNP